MFVNVAHRNNADAIIDHVHNVGKDTSLTWLSYLTNIRSYSLKILNVQHPATWQFALGNTESNSRLERKIFAYEIRTINTQLPPTKFN
ncbi:hypothetical protein NPIL_674641 [Nephila pilipes]|uniref:Uncharacterized protein n=1 Tax=Nephila pilipes TaxID=299642 RepID=A0A8X6UIX1_NEPPI|nr:hypothetical protein NPIL_674641 [Nephila pilipes]